MTKKTHGKAKVIHKANKKKTQAQLPHKNLALKEHRHQRQHQLPAAAKTAKKQPLIQWQDISRKLAGWPLGRIYSLSALAILTASSLLWSILAATINQSNADQLVNGYMFESADSFQQAVFPAQHSFLLKWPLFWALRAAGFSEQAFIAASVLAALATIAILTWIIYRIERRPLYNGTLCLALASVLLLVPTQPYAGGLLPVNMAMSTTRNLEYALYLAIIFYMAGLARKYAGAHRLRRVLNWRSVGILLALALLIASDRLFMVIALGGAALGCLASILFSHRKLLRHSLWWFTMCGLATLTAGGIIWVLDGSGVTTILGQSSSSGGSGPYDLVLNMRNIALGSFYAIGGLFTNLGANPAYDATVLRNVPSVAWHRLLSVAGPAYLVNIGVLLAGLIAAGHLGHSVFGSTRRKLAYSRLQLVSLTLIWSALAATAAFILTSHEYAVDARYLGIWLFTIFVCLATYSKTKIWPQRWIIGVGLTLLVAIACGCFGAIERYQAESAALAQVAARNDKVVQALSHHGSDKLTLVGDYWRVVPIKHLAAVSSAGSGSKSESKSKSESEPKIKQRLNVLPLANCTQPRDLLTSKAWQPNLRTSSFAYLLSTDKGLTDFPTCSLQQAIQNYGRPSSTVIIEGSVAQPKEVLLIYDRGTSRTRSHYDNVSRTSANVLPISLNKLPASHTVCNGQPTIMNIVAHEDDDLLFMNPDVYNDLAAKRCVRTIYLTAGDAGSDSFYWLNRERGSEAAYDVLDGAENDIWIQQIVDVTSGAPTPNTSSPSNLPSTAKPLASHYVTIASPRQNPGLSLIFFHLPDGGLRGEGFNRSHHESLSRLEAGTISQVHTVDGQLPYTADDLTMALEKLMQTYQPVEIRAQADYEDRTYPDHSDHRATSRFATRAKQRYDNQLPAPLPIKYYIGYPVRTMPENVAGNELDNKQAAFFAYAKLDTSVCQSAEDCANVSTYYSYLRRQYSYSQ